MSLSSYRVLQSELKNLSGFYNDTILAYQQALYVLHLRYESPTDFDRELKKNGITWSSDQKKTRKLSQRNKTESILHELILVRAISALETFLTDAIRDIFVVTKIPFMDKEVRHNLSQEELIANNSPTKIYSRIINKETRKLTSGGFNEFIKYYKKRFNIDLSSIDPGYKIMNEYHDRRHILVHRLGKTDEIYRKKYHTEDKKLTVDSSYVNSLLTDIKTFSIEVEKLVNSVITNSTSNSSTYNARYIADILFLKQEMPSCLQPNYQFWADDEYVVMSDILVGTSHTDDGKVRHYFNGSNRALIKIQRYLKNEQKKQTISVNVVVNLIRKNHYKVVSEEVLKEIEKQLPKQPWPTGIHKEIAKNLGVTNQTVSSVIDMLISKGVFKNQVNGEIID